MEDTKEKDTTLNSAVLNNKILEEFEKLFAKRFTGSDDDYVKHCDMELPQPPMARDFFGAGDASRVFGHRDGRANNIGPFFNRVRGHCAVERHHPYIKRTDTKKENFGQITSFIY